MSFSERPLSDYAADVCEQTEVRRGLPLPPGAHESEGGANFALFSRHASRVRLELFDRADDAAPARSIDLDPARNRTGDVWHVWVQGIRTGQLYAYRVDGPYRPQDGHRYNFNKLLLDPFAMAISQRSHWDFGAARGDDPAAHDPDRAPSPADDAGAMPKCVFIHEPFHWHDDLPPRRAWSETVIYETHVRGYTVHPSAGVEHPGTYRGLMEKIPYLKALGVTAVELMPVHEFNEWQLPVSNPQTGEPLRNYWGYDPVAFLAPKAAYSSAGGQGQQTLEFREMVRAFHQDGIEVILDVVFNHTAEGNELGPTLSFRGIDNAIFYMLAPDPRHYLNFAGTGNTINANHPVVRDHILGALRHWVVEMHVDGFRFDLASILARDSEGRPKANPSLLWDIESDPVLAGTKLIAEAWDAGGLYQVGSFIGDSWKEWNGCFRDDVRAFFRGEPGTAGRFASRLLGSPDIYGHEEREAEQSINFVTCHDGFTLNDLVSYDRKHNEANGEGNRDGMDNNHSWNCGVEGASGDPAVEKLRERQCKNLLATTLLAFGVPMILMGDEIRRTQAGNNNGYCQDNETSWFDWTAVEKHAGLLRFVQHLAALRIRRDTEAEHLRLSLNQLLDRTKIEWHGVRLNRPDWGEASHTLALSTHSLAGLLPVHLLFNAYWEALDFELPALANGGVWRRWIDTALDSPEDIVDLAAAPPVNDQAYRVEARSVVVLLAPMEV